MFFVIHFSPLGILDINLRDSIIKDFHLCFGTGDLPKASCMPSMALPTGLQPQPPILKILMNFFVLF
jgi:hypothetical protein